jgi:hypothetical protein
MKNEELRQFLASKDACQSAMDWLGDRDSGHMWAECERPDWLLWWAAHAVPRQELVLAACDCAELALRYVPQGEHRPRLAIETARRWARGEATVEEVRAADTAAIAAFLAAGNAAAYAALTAYAPRASDAALTATRATRAAGRAARATMCQLIRARWPECPLPEVTA